MNDLQKPLPNEIIRAVQLKHGLEIVELSENSASCHVPTAMVSQLMVEECWTVVQFEWRLLRTSPFVVLDLDDEGARQFPSRVAQDRGTVLGEKAVTDEDSIGDKAIRTLDQ